MIETQILLDPVIYHEAPFGSEPPSAAEICKAGFIVQVRGFMVASGRVAFDEYMNRINIYGDGPEHGLNFTEEMCELVRLSLSPPYLGGMAGGSKAEHDAEIIWREALEWRAQLLYRLVRSFSPEHVAILDAVARIRGLRLVPRQA